MGPTEGERQAKRLAVQYEIARAFAEADRLQDVAGLFLRTVVDALGWRAAAIWMPDPADGWTEGRTSGQAEARPTGGRTDSRTDALAEARPTGGVQLVCAAIHPTEGPLKRWADYSRAIRLPYGVGLPGRVWASGQAYWIVDTEGDENFPRRPVAREVGLRHGFGLPIWVNGAVAAVVELFAADVRELDEEEAAFLEALGHQLGSFIERIDARRAVAVSEARKSAILQAAVDAIVSANADGRIVEFNQAAEQLFGRRREDVVGARIADVLVPEELRAQHVAGLERYLATGKARVLGQRVRVRALRADGSTLPVELTITETRLDDRPMFTAFLRDITRQREAEIARERFLEILSHELRTPVTAVYGGAKLAARDSVTEAQRAELLEDVAAEADRLYRLVEDLMVVARAERGSAPLVLEPVNVTRIVERVIAAVRLRWPDVEFRTKVLRDGPPVDADETYVEQLLRNLVVNAAKYASSGRIVEVEVEPSAAETIVRVLDRGPGIDPIEADSLFEIDYRSPRTKAAASGSGIGLFVARWLVESMGGRIWARPRDGGGSEFGFSLRAADVSFDETGSDEAASDEARLDDVTRRDDVLELGPAPSPH